MNLPSFRHKPFCDNSSPAMLLDMRWYRSQPVQLRCHARDSTINEDKPACKSCLFQTGYKHSSIKRRWKWLTALEIATSQQDEPGRYVPYKLRQTNRTTDRDRKADFQSSQTNSSFSMVLRLLSEWFAPACMSLGPATQYGRASSPVAGARAWPHMNRSKYRWECLVVAGIKIQGCSKVKGLQAETFGC